MSSGPSGYLLYGYDLGGSEGDWAITEYNEDWYEREAPRLNVPWYLEIERKEREEADEAALDDDYFHGPDFRSLIEDRLMDAHLGVEIHSVGHHEYGSGATLVVSESRTWVTWSEVMVLDMAELLYRPHRRDWTDKLQRALNLLEIHPTQERPAWLLACAYG